MKNNFKTISKICLGLGAAVGIPVFMVAPGHASKRQKAPFMYKNCAHRGLHTRDKSVPENSLAAFKRAADAEYGVELDVQLSKDGQVVVFHDDTLLRVCGIDKRVDELDYSELKKLSLCGTKETIPLFTEVLAAIRGRSPIICELKTTKRRKELCQKTYDIISSYRGDICIESFDPLIVTWFRFHGKDLLRGQLANSVKSYGDILSKPVAFILSRCLFNVISRPHFIAYKLEKKPALVKLSYLLGAMKVCWTSHEPRNEKGKDCVIFEFYQPKQVFKK